MENSEDRLTRVLSDDQSELLCAPFEQEEINASLKKGWVHAAPGSDGLPRSFYKHFWEHLSPTLLQLALDAQNGALFNQEFNEGIVALLRKNEVDAPESGHYRPITLLNTDYKLIAGLVAGRLKIDLEQNLETFRSIVQ